MVIKRKKTDAAAPQSASTGRFVIANRLAGRSVSRTKRSRDSLDTAFEASLFRSVTVLGDSASDRDDHSARRVIVIEGDTGEIAHKAEDLGADTIIEPEYPRRTLEFDLAALATRGTIPLPSGTGRSVEVHLTSGGVPVPAVRVMLLLGSLFSQATTVVVSFSDADGAVSLAYDSSVWQPQLVYVEPQSGYWSVVLSAPASVVDLELIPLPKTGPLGWWQFLEGNPGYSETRGQGVRIGVIDTGVGPHPYLSHVTGIGAFIGGTYMPAPNATLDVGNHGTHVSGIIGARPAAGSGDFGGIASGADLFVARVFQAGQDANQGDIAAAIDMLSSVHAVDLINLSLGGDSSEIELDAVRFALQSGTLCICAAGNTSGGAVLYPAAYPETIAVSGLGLLGTSPPTSSSSSFSSIPTARDKFGVAGLFLAQFSAVGPQIRCAAPGNGIISTVPVWNADPAPYVAMDGTSMASPAATAAAAVRLSQDPAYLALPRNADRATYAYRSLLGGAVSVGLAAQFQGAGLARV